MNEGGERFISFIPPSRASQHSRWNPIVQSLNAEVPSLSLQNMIVDQ
jgi:hypothetical protein